MNIRPIRTEADYREALSLVDSLWAKAAPGNPEGDQLDVLVTLIQAYEREHYPMPPPDPIEAIKFRIDQMGIGRKCLDGTRHHDRSGKRSKGTTRSRPRRKSTSRRP